MVFADDTCGEVVTLDGHGRSTTSYSLAMPPRSAAQASPVLVLLLMRLPKIALYYYLVRIGWSLS